MADVNEMDSAAQAFDADIQSEAPARQSPGPKKDITEGPPERLFENVGELEVDEESPAKGGGDDDEDPSPKTGEDDEEADDEDPDATGDEGDDDEEVDPDEKAFFEQEVEVIVDGKEKKVSLRE